MYSNARTAPWGRGANLARLTPTHIATITRATRLLLFFPQSQLEKLMHSVSRIPPRPPKSHATRYPILYPKSKWLSSRAVSPQNVRDALHPTVCIRNNVRKANLSTSLKGPLSLSEASRFMSLWRYHESSPFCFSCCICRLSSSHLNILLRISSATSGWVVHLLLHCLSVLPWNISVLSYWLLLTSSDRTCSRNNENDQKKIILRKKERRANAHGGISFINHTR